MTALTGPVQSSGRILIGVYQVKLLDGLFVAVDRQTATVAEVAPGQPASWPSAREAIAWCTANSAKARRR